MVKVEVANSPKIEKPEYPVIKIRIATGGLTVLFTAPKVGTVLKDGSNSCYGVGHHRTDWVDDNWEYFDSFITLSND